MNQTIGVIGGGTMGYAILLGIDGKHKVFLHEKDNKRANYLNRKLHLTVADLQTLIENCQIIILAVKPQDFDKLLKQIRKLDTKNKLIISIAAGISCQYIKDRLSPGTRIVRAMPNLPIKIKEGITALSDGTFAPTTDLRNASRIFRYIGKTVIVEESWMNAITAVSGSGPAYMFYFVECFTKAAKSLGLDDILTRILITQTLQGSLNVLNNQKLGADVLRAQVTSKGGTTQAALKVFEKTNFEKTFKDALKAACKRAKDLEK